MNDLFSLPLLLDGGTGTELQKRGMPAGVCTEQWILEHTDVLIDLQRAYVDAGAQVLTAPTFGASPAALGRFGLEGEAEKYNRRLVELSREASGGRALVAGDLAPCGMKNAGVDKLTENYKVQTRALRDAGVDLYLAETMLSLEEAAAAVLAVREADPGRPVLVSFYPGAVDVMDVFSKMQDLGVSGIGLNCAPPEIILELLKRFAPMAGVPLLAMPGFEGTAAPDALARYAGAFAALGVSYFGGCCGTGPAHIAALKGALRGF